MQTGKLFMMASCLTVLGLVVASCAPAAAPTAQPTVAPAAKQAAPTPKPAEPAAKPAAPTPKAVEPATTPKPAAPASTPKPSGEQPKYGGHLSLPTPSDPPDLDIHKQVTIGVFALIGGIYNGVVQYDQNDRIVGDLAERWEASSDGKSYTFHLRKGVKWHDGKPFTSADAKFSLERMAPLGLIVLEGDKFETPDENTLRVSLSYSRAGFVPVLAHGRALVGPKHVIDAKGDLKRDAVGTGPFKLKDYVVGTSFTVTRNDAYFMKGLPYLDGVTYYVIKDAATRFAAFRTGRVKIYGHPPTHGELRAFHVDMAKKTMPDAIVRTYAAGQAMGLMVNTTKAPWSDVRVRRAAFIAVDRQKGLDVVAEGVGEIGVSTFLGEWTLPKEEMLKMPGFRKPKDQDIAEAKRLMAEAGYEKGFTSSVLVRAAYPQYENVATFMKDQFAAIGIDLKLEVIDYAVWADRRSKLAFDTIAAVHNVPLPDPDSASRYLFWTGGGTFSTLDDEKTMELFRLQSQTTQPEERKKVVWQLQYRVAETVPHIMVGWADSFIAFWPEVKNYTATGGVFLHNKLEDIWLAR